MTITIRAHVCRVYGHPSHPWAARATARRDGRLIDPDASRVALAPSWPEAMQAAHVLLADLDRELMGEVHASRSSRHAERDAKLAAETCANGVAITMRECGPHCHGWCLLDGIPCAESCPINSTTITTTEATA